MKAKDIIYLLDNSADAETIALEIVSCETLHNELSAAYNCIEQAYIGPNEDDCIAIIIRELWDIAYTYGYYDGCTESED